MILKASQRAGGKQLAAHLLRMDENDHVEVHELRGFIADDLKGAFHEAYAISRGTKCQQFLFSVSLNPPENETVPIEAFEAAISAIEERMALSGQPRAVVFHEKEGRRHAHCVWSRIDSQTMRAIPLPHFKLKLRDISRQLYLDYGWKMPLGLVDGAQRDPLSFTREEWQQARRTKVDVRALKTLLQDCWAISDSKAAFASALSSRGYYLAQGDRRGFVALDFRGEVYSLSRWLGVKAKELRARLGDPDALPTVESVRKDIAVRMSNALGTHIDAAQAAFDAKLSALDAKRRALATRHREARRDLKARHDDRNRVESRQRSSRLRQGILGLWDWIVGRSKAIRAENEIDARECAKRDRAEKQALIEMQLGERRRLQHEVRQTRRVATVEVGRLHQDVAAFLRMSKEGQELALRVKEQHPSRRRRLDLDIT